MLTGLIRVDRDKLLININTIYAASHIVSVSTQYCTNLLI